MFRKACIFFLFFFISLLFSQERETNYSLTYPRFIPVNSSFDISLTVTNNYPDANEFILIVYPDNRLILNRADYKSVYESFKIDFTKNSDDFSREFYSLKINLNDSLRTNGTVCQILLNFISEELNASPIKIEGLFKNNDSTLAYLWSENNTDEIYIDSYIEFYKPQKIADKGLLLSDNSLFQMDLGKKINHNLLIEFWIKFNEAEIDFLRLYRKDFIQPDYILTINEFQMMSVSSNQGNQSFVKPFFVGKKSWYHISILLSKENKNVSFFCDGNKVADFNIPGLFEEDNLRIVFENLYRDKSFMIDLLRVIDLNNSINSSFNNSHSIHFNSDSSSIIANYKFDSQNEFDLENKNVELEFSDIKFGKSDAPIFARSPELNIRLLGISYELEWKGGDYKQAEYYFVEKSVGNKPYISVQTIQVDNTLEKSYSFIDVADESSGIVYYRVKQQNYDGSVVYSSQVKIGQGEQEPFTLEQNYPNPFNPKTSIVVEILEDSDIEIIIYSLDGTEISKLYKGFLSKGLHRFSFDAEGLPSGIYLYKVTAINFTQTRKMILTK